MSCWGFDVADVMCALEDRLVFLKISGKEHEFDEEEIEDLKGLAYGCTRLRKINWDCVEPEGEGNCEALESILLGVGVSLHKLHVFLPVLEEPEWLNPYTFGWGVSLRKFYYRGWSALLLEEVAKQNAELETVGIFTDVGGRNEEFCLHVVESFSCCRKLRELFVSTYCAVPAEFFLDDEQDLVNEKLPVVQEVCKNYCLSCTNQYVTLFGLQYLPIC